MTKEYRCMLGIQEMTVFSFLLIYVIKVSGLFLGTYKFLLVFLQKPRGGLPLPVTGYAHGSGAESISIIRLLWAPRGLRGAMRP